MDAEVVRQFGISFPLPKNALSMPKEQLLRAFESDPTLTPREAVSRYAVTMTLREALESERRARGAVVPARRRRQVTGPSVSYSVRLDVGELAALEDRAAELGLKPTVLARNLIRCGLAAGRSELLTRALDGIDQAVAEVRALVG